MTEKGPKPGGMTVHEALMDGKMQVFFRFLEEKAEDLKDLSFEEKTAEYLRSRGVAKGLIENYLELQERVTESIRKAAVPVPTTKIKLSTIKLLWNRSNFP